MDEMLSAQERILTSSGQGPFEFPVSDKFTPPTVNFVAFVQQILHLENPALIQVIPSNGGKKS
jgi:hypothetical protein